MNTSLIEFLNNCQISQTKSETLLSSFNELIHDFKKMKHDNQILMHRLMYKFDLERIAKNKKIDIIWKSGNISLIEDAYEDESIEIHYYPIEGPNKPLYYYKVYEKYNKTDFVIDLDKKKVLYKHEFYKEVHRVRVV